MAVRVGGMKTYTYYLPEYQSTEGKEWQPVRVCQAGPHVPFANVPALFETEQMARDYVADLDRTANGIFSEFGCEWRFTPVEVPVPHQWPV
jgi:ribosome-associated toxin RatA of RatAB toxin-antitoxin module